MEEQTKPVSQEEKVDETAKKDLPPQPKVRTTPQFRLKDNPPQRRFQFIYLKKVFGFLPEVIVVEKVPGANNRLQLSAIIPADLVEKIEKEEREAKEKSGKVEEKTAKEVTSTKVEETTAKEISQ